MPDLDAARVRSWLKKLASVRITLALIALSMILVALGTVAQVDLGTFPAQKVYFNSFWVYRSVAGTSIPVFPGGLTVGALWMVNLTAAFLTQLRRAGLGLLMTHAGLTLLMLGQLLTQTFAKESQLPFEVGQTRSYSESTSEAELALTTPIEGRERVVAVPESVLSRLETVPVPDLGFSIRPLRYFENTELRMGGGGPPAATQGVGARVTAVGAPPVSSDDDANVTSAVIEVESEGRSLGTWLVSTGLGAPQSFFAKGREFKLALRPRRRYFPFSLTLKEFRHDIYPGTDVPRNFASLVRLADRGTGESRDVLIYMNHPLRYGGRTFYQASFGKGDTLSVLQVVENPIWVTPYVACALMALGMALQFLGRFAAGGRRPA